MNRFLSWCNRSQLMEKLFAAFHLWESSRVRWSTHFNICNYSRIQVQVSSVLLWFPHYTQRCYLAVMCNSCWHTNSNVDVIVNNSACTHRKASAVQSEPGQQQSTHTIKTMATPPLKFTACAWINRLKCAGWGLRKSSGRKNKGQDHTKPPQHRQPQLNQMLAGAMLWWLLRFFWYKTVQSLRCL